MVATSIEAEIPVTNDRVRCILCKELRLPAEMHSVNVCLVCYEAKRARNAGKPKPKNRPENNQKSIQTKGLGWKDRPEGPVRRPDSEYLKAISCKSIGASDTENASIDNGSHESEAEDSIRVSETGKESIAIDLRKTESVNSLRVSDTENVAKDCGSEKPMPCDGNIVSDTERELSISNLKEPACIESIRASGTRKKLIDTDNHDTVAGDGIKVFETQRIAALEESLGITNDALATAFRRIAALEEQIQRLSPVIEKEDARRNAAGLQKLRDDLHALLRDRMKKTQINGIYIHSLYGPNGRKGGKLGISKMQAYRLRDACRSDDRFKVEKAENQRGNWSIRLNLLMK